MSDAGYVRISDQSEEDKCAARLVDGKHWECVPCALGFDEGDRPPACSRLTFTRLIHAAIDEALRIEASQTALVAAGDRKFRHQGQLKRAMELRALARLAAKMRDEREDGR